MLLPRGLSGLSRGDGGFCEKTEIVSASEEAGEGRLSRASCAPDENNATHVVAVVEQWTAWRTEIKTDNRDTS